MRSRQARRFRLLAAALTLAVPGSLLSQVVLGPGSQASDRPGAAARLGQVSGMLPSDHLTEESAIQVNLDTETVRMPLYKGVAYKGTAQQETVWYLVLDASDNGLAHDLGVNYAPKLANIGIGCVACVQTVTLDSPTPAQNPFGSAIVNFQGAPDFSPTRIAVPGPSGFPLASFQPGAVAGPGYSPFIRIAGSDVFYNAPIVATGDQPFDVAHHTNTSDRAVGVHIAPPAPPGQYADSWADMLLIKGFDAGQPIIYLTTDAGQPLTSVLERATYVPALDSAAFNGGDDFLGSSRERLFAFANGQSGPDNPQSQGFQHLALDSHISDDASADNAALISSLRYGGDLLEVFGDFPTLSDPRHANAYCPLWDAQLGKWTDKAKSLGLNTRQIDENQVFNLAASRPDLITGVDPATGETQPYGSVGVDINCAVIGYTAKAPTANLAPPLPSSQFPPRSSFQKGVERVAGSDRIATGIAASLDSFAGAGSTDAAVLATAADFPDALAGVPLAVAKQGPLLLTGPTELDGRVQTELERVVPAGGTIYVLGGSKALSPSIDTTLQDLGYKVVRFQGANRYETSAAIASSGLADPATVVEATGLSAADALSGGAAAAAAHAAILLTSDSTQSPATASYLAAHPNDRRFAVGRPAASADPSATPLVGTDRFDTSALVARMFFTSPGTIGFVNGLSTLYADGLTGGADIAEQGGPLLLVDPSTPLPPAVATYLHAVRGGVAAGEVYGGTTVVGDEVITAVSQQINVP